MLKFTMRAINGGGTGVADLVDNNDGVVVELTEQLVFNVCARINEAGHGLVIALACLDRLSACK